ncbi:MAG: ATP synthase F1 subunit delta [Lachnospiraceae bacterium]
MAKLISKTYGEALFSLALEENKVDLLMDELQSMFEVLKTNKEYTTFIQHPKVPLEEKLKVTEDVFLKYVSRELVGFISLIIKKGRFSDIFQIFEFFIDSVKEHKGIGVAYIESPVALSDTQKREIENRLLQTTNFKTMEMNYTLEPKLIGGLKIRIKDRVVDSSVLNKLNILQRTLLKVQI